MSTQKIWMLPANPKYYDVDRCIAKYGECFWRQHYSFNTGDVIYLYISSPDRFLRYKCLVIEHDLPFSREMEIDREFFIHPRDYESSRDNRFMKFRIIGQSSSEKMTMTNLLKNGMKRAPQGCMILSDPKYLELLRYIEENF